MKWNSKRAQYATTVSPKPVSVTAHEDGASPYGVLNMSGNVFEWVEDCYHGRHDPTSFTARPRGGEGAFCSERVLRGGSWWFDGRDNARASSRFGFQSQVRRRDFGFRLLCTPPTE